MIGGLPVVAVIPARGGSKTVPGKNIRPLGGKPLLAWSVEAARAVAAVDRIIVSTDDREIARVAEGWGAEVWARPPELAGDEALVIDALRHLIRELGREGLGEMVMVLLEPTCPLRSPEDIRRCLETLAEGQLDAVATFKGADLNPHRAWTIEGGRPAPFIDGADPWQPRQKQPPAYQLNGAVYAFRADRLPGEGTGLLFGRTGAVITPAHRSLDIDHLLDFTVAEALLAEAALSPESRS